MTDVHPTHLADIDQDRAELRQLVDAAREHTDATCCEHRGVCSGDVVHDVLSELPADELQALLELAVAELAALKPLIVAAKVWRAQFEKPVDSKPPRMAALMAAVDALQIDPEETA